MSYKTISPHTKMKHISEQTRNDIISLLNENITLSKIASKVGISISTVSRVCNRLGRQHITNRGGRPGKLSQQDRRMAMRLVTSGKVECCTSDTRVEHQYKRSY